MATTDDFANEVIRNVPNCPYPLVIDEVRRAVQKFCERAWVWREYATNVSVVSGTWEYTITPPTDTLILGLTKSYKLDTVDNENESNIITNYTFTHPNTIKFWAEPTEAYTLRLECAVKPDHSIDAVEDFILDMYFDAIVQGATYRLLSMPGKSWSDPKASNYHYRGFRMGVSYARRNINSQYGKKELKVRIPRFV